MICEKCKGDCFEVNIDKLEQCDYMIIAERPMYTETITGAKFTKHSFRPLTQFVREMKLNNIYATYAQKTYTSWSSVKAKKCYTHLLKEIEKVQPKVIVCIGTNASRFVTNKTGDIHALADTTYFDKRYNAWIICTYDPGMIFRDATIEIKIKGALRRMIDQKDQVPLVESFTTYTPDTVEEHVEMLTKMIEMEPRPIAFDIESEGLNYFHDEVLAIGFGWEKDLSYTIQKRFLENIVISQMIQHLFTLDHTFVAQNGKFDTSFLRFDLPFKNVVIPTARFDEDTMLMHYCLNNVAGTHGLKVWARDYFHADDWESDIKTYLPTKDSPYSMIPEPILHKYLGYDIHWTLRGYYLFKTLMEKEGVVRPYKEILLPASQAFTEIEPSGVLLDVEKLKQKMAEAEPEMERISKELLEEAEKIGWSPEAYVKATGAKTKPETLNPKSSKQMQWVAYDLCEMPLWNMGRAGFKKSCCKDAVEVYRFRHPFWAKLHEYKQVNDLFGIYVKGMLERVDADGRIRPDFYLTGTVTGRISCHNPNLQNIPRKSFVKEMFIADEDNVIVNIDYKTLEIIVAAILSGDPEMLQPFIDHEDFHSKVTWDVYGEELQMLKESIPSCEGTKMLEYLDRPQMMEVREYITRDYINKEKYEEAWDQIFDYCRFLTKFVTFGILYKRGAKSLAEGELNCEVWEAQKYIDNFEAKYTRLIEWQNEQLYQASTKQFVTTAFEFKRRWSGMIDEYLVKSQSANSAIQGTAAQITLRALAKIHKKFSEVQYALGRVLFTVHDSIVFEIPKKRLFESLNTIKEYMCYNPIKPEIPLTIEIEVGNSYGTVFPLVERDGKWIPEKSKHQEKYDALLGGI
jgi:DNA polymerase I